MGASAPCPTSSYVHDWHGSDPKWHDLCRMTSELALALVYTAAQINLESLEIETQNTINNFSLCVGRSNSLRVLGSQNEFRNFNIFE